MIYLSTLFTSIFDSRTNKTLNFGTWDIFISGLKKLSEKRLKTKADAQLISPAIYVNDDNAAMYSDALKEPDKTGSYHYYHRKNINVIAWQGWAAVDVDDIEIDGDIEDYIISRYGDKQFICYSTASSTKENPKFRLLFNLGKPLLNNKIKHFWFALNKELGEIGDGQCKDLSRMYYVPATYDNAYNFFFVNDGAQIDADKLCDKYSYVEERKNKNFFDNLPEGIKKKVIQHRKNNMDKQFSWTHYSNCPFVNKKQITEYKKIARVDGTGRYAMIYKIMTSIAMNAVSKEYPISTDEIVKLISQLDIETSRKYDKRPLNVEANRAIEYAYRKV
jgi:hypothetical protein